MEVIIEKSPVCLNNNYLNHDMLCEFNDILYGITSATTKENIKDHIDSEIGFSKKYKYFNAVFLEHRIEVYQCTVKRPENNEVYINPALRILYVNL